MSNDAKDLYGYKNLLVQYQGGGYDGCFWEWNYFIFDKEGTFHDIGSSGRNGITDEQTAKDYLSDDYNQECIDYFLVDMNDPESIEHFSKSSNDGHVRHVTDQINEIYGFQYEEYPMFWICDYCERKTYDIGVNSSYQGCGGIAISMEGKVCDDCESIRSCGYCGEFHDNPDNLVNGDYGFFSGDKCIYCLTDDEKKILCENCPYLTVNGCTNDSCVHMDESHDIHNVAETIGNDWYDWVMSIAMNEIPE